MSTAELHSVRACPRGGTNTIVEGERAASLVEAVATYELSTLSAHNS